MMISSNIQTPIGWENVTLEDVAEIKIGGTPARKTSDYWDEEKETKNYWVAISDLNKKYIYDTNERISDLGVENSNVKLIPKNTVMMSFKLSLGRVAINKVDLYTNEAIASFIPLERDTFITEFMYYALQLINYSNSVDIAVKGKTLNKTKLKGLPLSLPPKLEQQKIAAILSSVDEAIEKTEQIIEQTETVKKGLMQQLLTKGIGHTEFRDSQVGVIPQEWDIKPLRELLLLLKDGTHNPPKKMKSGIPMLSAININHDTINFENNSNFISEVDYYSMHKKYEIIENDILLTIVGSIGRVAIVGKDIDKFTVQRSVAILRTNSSTEPEFLKYFVQTHYFQSTIERRSNSTAQTGIYLKELGKINIPIPNKVEQKRIVNILKAIDEKKSDERNKLIRLETLKQGLMQQLLTGKVRVPINEEEEVPS